MELAPGLPGRGRDSVAAGCSRPTPRRAFCDLANPRLLEDSLGYALFDRANGALALNAAGRQLLEAVRTAMRTVNEAQSGQSVHDGPCHIYCPTDIVPLLVDAVETWIAAQPQSPPIVHVPCAEDVCAQLLRGDLDIAIAFEPAMQAGVTSVPLGQFSSSLYCARSHPCSELERLTEEDLATQSFVDYPVGELSFLRVMTDREKQSVAYMPTMELAIRLCARGIGLVCVPDFIVETTAPELVRLPRDLPLARLFIWYRRPVSDGQPAIVEHLIDQPIFSTLVRDPPAWVPKPRPKIDARVGDP